MKKNKSAKKEIIRDQRFEIRMSKEEKKLFYTYAEDMGINPTRLARNLLMIEAEAKLTNKLIFKPTIQAYKKYLEITKQYEVLDQINEE